MENWEVFLSPYKQAVEEIKIKLKGIREQYQMSKKNTPIEFVTARVKPVASILGKAKRKNISLDRIEDDLQDIAGVRVVCPFVEDINTVVEIIRSRSDFEIAEEKDYITEKKESGYRSFHIILKYPVETIAGKRVIFVELQIRTLAMNFWATIEHSLKYKFSGEIPQDVKERLYSAAEAAFILDEEMSQIRDVVKDAQQSYSKKYLDNK